MAVSVVGAGATVWAVLLRTDRNRLREGIEVSQQQTREAEKQLVDLNAQLAAAHEKQRGLTERFEQAQQQSRDAFKATAGEVLEQANRQFLQLAKKSFEGEQKDAAAQLEQRKQAIDAVVKPLKESLDKYGTEIKQIEGSRKEAYGGLKQQLVSLIEDQKLLKGETANLVKALRRPEVRGQWGEMHLKRVVEMAGMVEHCDFTQQVSVSTEQGRLQPDMVVFLPSSRTIVVDAKTPLDAFLQAAECGDEAQQNNFLEQHTRQIETQIGNLSKKAYKDQFERSPDFVVLFIPGESFLYPAILRRPSLIEDAMSKSVIIATPTILVSLLKVVALGWREEQLAENARKISEIGGQLHKRLCDAAEHLLNLGGSLKKAGRDYDKFVSSFDSRVMVTARKFEELGVTSAKQLPQELPQVHIMPREVKSVAAQGGDG